ncbi:MAG: MBL fold metallo-hydrolase [Bacteroidetes bacterium]|nr:MBL fold metallo-hydrolase [Bacteroidota bacterium]
MKLIPIIADNFKLDGGACFGVVPKSLWSRYVEADENNMIKITNRCLLVDTGSKVILIDTGLGRKQSQDFFDYFYLFGDDTLEKSLNKAGYTTNQITDVILTHLHFDHVGGAVKWAEDNNTPELVFKNATYYCSKAQYESALNPNPREKASYFRENFVPIFEAGKLKFIDSDCNFCPGVDIEIKNGHTNGQIIVLIDYKGKKIAYMGDFIAAIQNIPLPYVPAYDVLPLVSMHEKEEFLNRAVNNDYILFFEHDFDNECCNLKQTPKGVRHNEILKIEGI